MKFLKRLFCKHEYEHMTKNEPYFNLRGERIYIVCKKCEKIKDSYFREW